MIVGLSALGKFFFVCIKFDKGGSSLPKHFERTVNIHSNPCLNFVAFMEPNKHKMRSEGFSTTWPNLFSNTFATVGEFQRVLQSFVSIRFSQHDRTVTLIPNTSSSARSRSPHSPTHAFLKRQVPTSPSPGSLFFLRVRSRLISAWKQNCRKLIPEAFKRDSAIINGSYGKIL